MSRIACAADLPVSAPSVRMVFWHSSYTWPGATSTSIRRHPEQLEDGLLVAGERTGAPAFDLPIQPLSESLTVIGGVVDRHLRGAMHFTVRGQFGEHA